MIIYLSEEALTSLKMLNQTLVNDADHSVDAEFIMHESYMNILCRKFTRRLTSAFLLSLLTTKLIIC